MHYMHIHTNTGGQQRHRVTCYRTQTFSHPQIRAPPTSPSFPQLICSPLAPLPTINHSAPRTSPSAPHPPLSPIPPVLPLTHHLSLPHLTHSFPPSPCWPLCCLTLVRPCSASWWSGCSKAVHGSPSHQPPILIHPSYHLVSPASLYLCVVIIAQLQRIGAGT